jgi:hypothetical protein
MPNSARRMPVLAYSLSGLAALKDSILYIPVWIVVFIIFSVVYTVFFDMVAKYHAGQILINLRHYAAFDFANLSDANSLDYILQIKDITELGLPIVLAFFTVIPIAVARSRLIKGGDATAHIGFGQSELIVALNTLISYLPVLLFFLGLNIVFHVVGEFLAPHLGGTPDASAIRGVQPPAWLHPVFGTLSKMIVLPILFFTYVKTSLSLPYSAEENRLGVLYSWRATSGRFWTILQIEALALVWAVLVCAVVYGGFVLLYEFLFEKIYTIHYSIFFTGEMNAQWFFNLVAVSVIFILFLLFTFGPIVQIYRFVRPLDDEAEPRDAGGDDPDTVTA